MCTHEKVAGVAQVQALRCARRNFCGLQLASRHGAPRGDLVMLCASKVPCGSPGFFEKFLPWVYLVSLLFIPHVKMTVSKSPLSSR